MTQETAVKSLTAATVTCLGLRTEIGEIDRAIEAIIAKGDGMTVDSIIEVETEGQTKDSSLPEAPEARSTATAMYLEEETALRRDAGETGAPSARHLFPHLEDLIQNHEVARAQIVHAAVESLLDVEPIRESDLGRDLGRDLGPLEEVVVRLSDEAEETDRLQPSVPDDAIRRVGQAVGAGHHPGRHLPADPGVSPREVEAPAEAEAEAEAKARARAEAEARARAGAGAVAGA